MKKIEAFVPVSGKPCLSCQASLFALLLGTHLEYCQFVTKR